MRFLKAHGDDLLVHVQERGNIHQLRHLVLHVAALMEIGEIGDKMSDLRRMPWPRVFQGATWSVSGAW